MPLLPAPILDKLAFNVEPRVTATASSINWKKKIKFSFHKFCYTYDYFFCNSIFSRIKTKMISTCCLALSNLVRISSKVCPMFFQADCKIKFQNLTFVIYDWFIIFRAFITSIICLYSKSNLFSWIVSQHSKNEKLVTTNI